uniref:Uncharacterized protein n=1 Tax=Anopheles funestus TaxID=62324 RepID=A0A182S386_ANOFN
MCFENLVECRLYLLIQRCYCRGSCSCWCRHGILCFCTIFKDPHRYDRFFDHFSTKTSVFLLGSISVGIL